MRGIIPSMMLLLLVIYGSTSSSMGQQYTTYNPIVLAKGIICLPNGAQTGSWEIFQGSSRDIWIWEVGNTVRILKRCSPRPGFYTWIMYWVMNPANPMDTRWWRPRSSGRAMIAADPSIAQRTQIAFTEELIQVGPESAPGSWVLAANPNLPGYGFLINPNGVGEYMISDINLIYSGCRSVLVQQIRCPICGKSFYTIDEYQNHRANC
jgi:hypothetical protein